jgi:hypothetical protein
MTGDGGGERPGRLHSLFHSRLDDLERSLATMTTGPLLHA